jgi:hypothetical protein
MAPDEVLLSLCISCLKLCGRLLKGGIESPYWKTSASAYPDKWAHPGRLRKEEKCLGQDSVVLVSTTLQERHVWNFTDADCKRVSFLFHSDFYHDYENTRL